MKKYLIGALALSLLLPLSGCMNENTTPPQKQEETKQTPAKKGPGVLYLPSEDGTGVLPKTLTLTHETTDAAQILTALIAADRAAPYPLFPENLTVRSVSIKDSIATVDFSKELKNLAAGQTTETLFITSVVNTLTEDPAITGVRFTIEGTPIQKLSGHYDMTQIFKRTVKS